MAVLTLQYDIAHWTWTAFDYSSDTFDYFDNKTGRIYLFAKWENTSSIANGDWANLIIHEQDDSCEFDHDHSEVVTGICPVSDGTSVAGPFMTFRFNDPATGMIKIEPRYPDGTGEWEGGSAAAGWSLAAVQSTTLDDDYINDDGRDLDGREWYGN